MLIEFLVFGVCGKVFGDKSLTLPEVVDPRFAMQRGSRDSGRKVQWTGGEPMKPPVVDMCQRAVEMKFTMRGVTDLTRCGHDGICINLFWDIGHTDGLVLVRPGTVSPSLSRKAVTCLEAESAVVGNRKISHVFAKTPEKMALELPMHYQVTTGDPRPRLYIEFTNQNQNKPFSLLFDTGSNNFHVEERIRGAEPAVWNQYVDNGQFALDEGGRCIQYGLGDRFCSIIETKKVREKARIATTAGPHFTYSADLGLTGSLNKPRLEAGLIGAARTSSFTKAAKVFAWLPPRAAGRTESNAGSLLIGEHPWSRFCRADSPLVWLKLIKGARHWGVVGSASIGHGAPVFTNWLLDTGTYGLNLPYDAYMQLVAEIRRSGSPVETVGPGVVAKISNCVFYDSRFPVVAVKVADERSYFTLKFEPRDYIRTSRHGHCYLEIGHNGKVGNAEFITDLGTKFLEKLLTVFSDTDSSVGVCMRG